MPSCSDNVFPAWRGSREPPCVCRAAAHWIVMDLLTCNRRHPVRAHVVVGRVVHPRGDLARLSGRRSLSFARDGRHRRHADSKRVDRSERRQQCEDERRRCGCEQRRASSPRWAGDGPCHVVPPVLVARGVSDLLTWPCVGAFLHASLVGTLLQPCWARASTTRCLHGIRGPAVVKRRRCQGLFIMVALEQM